MSSEIIKMGYKSFQFFPLRTENTPKYIPLDTKSLVELFPNIGINKNKCFGDTAKYEKEIWKSIFNLDHKVFKYNNHEFNFRISTDGETASIFFIHKDFIEREKNKIERMKKGQEKARDEYEDLSRDEIEKRKDDKEVKNKKFKKSKKELEKEGHENFKKLNDDEQKEVKEKMKKKEFIEFPYLEELTEEQLIELKEKKLLGKVVYVDPGKKNILYIMNDQGVYFRYTNKERIFESKRLKYQDTLQRYKDEYEISDVENELIGFNSKACNVKEFKEYLKKKNEVFLCILKFYDSI
jgi:hypothetical protein